MISPEEKRALLEEIIPHADDHSKSKDFQQKLSALLLRDTKDGKLYKYRSFDPNGYALNNLISGTLHCSRSDSFNDPFDCKLGVSLTQAMEAVMDYPKIDTTFSNVLFYLSNRKDSVGFGEDEKAIIRDLLDNPQFVSLRERLLSKNENGFEQTRKAFFKEVVKATFSHFSRNQNGKVPAGLLESIDSLDFDEVIKSDHPPTFRDYLVSTGFPDNDVDEIKLVSQYSHIHIPGFANKSNDFEEFFSKLEKQIADQIVNRIRIGCLAGDQYNRLMWSHYADAHKGFCVEFDCKDIWQDHSLLPVYYSKERPPVPWAAILYPNSSNIRKAGFDMFWALVTKDQCWEYENEWRLFSPATGSADIKIPITTVYLGANITPENKESILKIATEHKIPVKQMTTDRGTYDLHAEDVLSFDGN